MIKLYERATIRVWHHFGAHHQNLKRPWHSSGWLPPTLGCWLWLLARDAEDEPMSLSYLHPCLISASSLIFPYLSAVLSAFQTHCIISVILHWADFPHNTTAIRFISKQSKTRWSSTWELPHIFPHCKWMAHFKRNPCWDPWATWAFWWVCI